MYGRLLPDGCRSSTIFTWEGVEKRREGGREEGEGGREQVKGEEKEGRRGKKGGVERRREWG